MAKNNSSFGQPGSNLKQAIANAHTPQAINKMKQTRKANTLIRSTILEELKNDLLETNNRNNKAYYSEYLDNFLKEAKKNPGGRCGQTVASVIFQEDLLSMLDEEQNKQMARDLDFLRFRAIKRLFKEQRDVVLDRDKRHKVIMCSRRAGKTDCNSTNIIYTAIQPNSPILYINKTFSNAIHQMWDLIIDQAAEIGLVIEKESKSDGRIEFSNGSSVTFSGNSNDAEADKLRGGKYRLVIIDEAGHQRNMKYLINEVLEPAMMDYEDSIMILTGTPPRVSHTYVEKLWNEDGYENYHWTMRRNPYIHNVDEEIERICKDKGLTKDSSFIQREYEGKMGCYDTEAMIFKGRHTREKYCDNNEDIKDYLDFEPTNLCLGVDFGWSDYNSIVTLAYNKNTRESRVIMESKFNKSDISTIVNVITDQYDICKGIALRYNVDIPTIEVFCDCNERSIVSELSRNYNVNAHTCWKYDKAMAIEQLAEELRTGRMMIYKGGALDDEMDQILHKRDENDNILPEIDEDLGIHPEATMALLYASRQMFLDFGYSTGGRSKEARGEE